MTNPHLYLLADDDALIARWGTQRVMARPLQRTAEPVLQADRPWEGGAVYLYGSVLHDDVDGLLRMWYSTRSGHLCHATSVDGLTWEKPDLGLHEVDGSRHNNVVYAPGDPSLPRHLDSPTVILDPADPDPARRFKLLVCADQGEQRGLAVLLSPDGMRWHAWPELVAPHQGDRGHVYYDAERRLYVATNRWHGNVREWRSEHHRRYNKRIVARAESDDFINWSDFRTVLKMDDLDPEDVQFYSLYPFRYGSRYLGFLEVYHTTTGYLDTQLASSGDGSHWQRIGRREPYLERGPDGSWDYNWVCSSSNPPFVSGDHMLIWYSGRQAPHGLAREGDRTGIGLMVMRRDGFAYLAAGAEGVIVTEPVTVAGAHLLVNANVHSAGQVRVELIDERGEPMAGYAREDCLPLTGDSVGHRVTWDGRNLSELVGRQVRLRLWAHHANLYSFEMRPAAD